MLSLPKVSIESKYLPKQNTDPVSETLVKALTRNFENNFSYDELLQFARCHWKELNQTDVISISTNKKSVLFTVPAQKTILFLAMKANGLVNAYDVTSEQFEAALKDLAQEDKKGVCSKNSLGTNDQKQINDILKNPNDCKHYFQEGIKSFVLFANSVENDQPFCILPFDVIQAHINNNLDIKDALSFSSACKELYLKFNSTLEIHTWEFTSVRHFEKFKIAEELLARSNKKLPDLQRPLAYFEKECGDSNKAKTEFFKHLATSCVELYLHLRKNPESVNNQDADGKTILNYAMEIRVRKLDFSTNYLCGKLLLNTPGIDSNITDETGNTFLHVLFNSKGSFPGIDTLNFLDIAIPKEFDWGIQNNEGETVLYRIVSNASCYNSDIIFEHLIRWKIPQLGSILDIPTKEGVNALHACMNEAVSGRGLGSDLTFDVDQWEKVSQLLDAGADPWLCDSQGKNALDRITCRQVELEVDRQRAYYRMPYFAPPNHPGKLKVEQISKLLVRLQELEKKMREHERKEFANCIIS